MSDLELQLASVTAERDTLRLQLRESQAELAERAGDGPKGWKHCSNCGTLMCWAGKAGDCVSWVCPKCTLEMLRAAQSQSQHNYDAQCGAKDREIEKLRHDVEAEYRRAEALHLEIDASESNRVKGNEELIRQRDLAQRRAEVLAGALRKIEQNPGATDASGNYLSGVLARAALKEANWMENSPNAATRVTS